MKKKIVNFLKLIIGLYIVLCGVLYFFQERLIFIPQKIKKDYQYNFSGDFKEMNFKSTDGKLLNGLLFKSDSTKGLVFYLHGNSGSLRSWGNIAKTYTKLNYDIFILDYRGFGKSEGKIENQTQLFEDNQTIYNQLKKEYAEEDIIILGYSIGTGMASNLASKNNPKQLILEAPYYSLTNIMHNKLSIIPTFLLKYKFATNEYLKDCKMPITIIHGNEDNVIDFESSVKLKQDFPQIKLITLVGQGHNGISDNLIYKREIKKIVEK